MTHQEVPSSAQAATGDMSHSPSESPTAHAARVLRAGGLVAFPTETVYGLGADAQDVLAVARIFEVKRRPRFDPLIVHLPSDERVESVVAEFPEVARRLAANFWPGPLTLVFPKNAGVPDIVTAGLPTVAVRVPDHPLALQFLSMADVPVAAPSANLFGHASPTTAQHVREQLGDDIDFVLDGGPCRVGIESTIVSVVGGRPALLRPGGVALEDIEEVAGPLARPSMVTDRPASPGQLRHHYAPRTPLVLHDPSDRVPARGRIGLLAFQAPQDPERFAALEVLSPSGDMREAAANLFAAIHRLDAAHLDLILAEPVPDRGLGVAINDRLSRASQGDPLSDHTRTKRDGA